MVPALGVALRELDEKVGLKEVKEATAALVKLAEANHTRELRGAHPLRVPLNRLFLGSPGTGKR